MKLIQFLIKNNIPFTELEEGCLLIDDNLLKPYEEEIRKEFPDFEFMWDYRRYRNEPNRSSDDENLQSSN
jgi:hypothetical protein